MTRLPLTPYNPDPSPSPNPNPNPNSSPPPPPPTRSPFFLASRESLSNTAGLLTISNHTLGLAVQGRYLDTPNARLMVHQELAAFFAEASDATCNCERRCEELPFQMLMARDLEGLTRFCLDLEVLRTLIRVGRFDLFRYWRAIGDGELPPDLGPRYTAALERYSPTLRAQVAARFGEHDNTKERAYQDELSHLCSLLGDFLSEVSYFATACALQACNHTLRRGLRHG